MVEGVRERPTLSVLSDDPPIVIFDAPGLATCILYVVAEVVAGLSKNTIFPDVCFWTLIDAMSFDA